MDLGILGIIISSITTVAVAIIGAYTVREGKRIDAASARAEMRADRREKEVRLMMELAIAEIDLSLVVAKKVTNQEVNGDLESAVNVAKVAKANYTKFINEIFAQQIAKV